jgi:hypothetical protein
MTNIITPAPTYTVRPRGCAAWSGPGLDQETAMADRAACADAGLCDVLIVDDATGEELEEESDV